MASATLTITDEPTGTVEIAADFGETFEQESQAHQMIAVLAQSILDNAKYTGVQPASNIIVEH